MKLFKLAFRNANEFSKDVSFERLERNNARTGIKNTEI